MAFNPARRPVSLVRSNHAPAAGRGRDEEREPVTSWLNIGYHEIDPETGDEVFVQLPLGLALTGMRDARSGSRALRDASNELRDNLLAIEQSLEPGETKMLNLQVQLRRVAEPTSEEEKRNNSLIRDVTSLIAV